MVFHSGAFGERSKARLTAARARARKGGWWGDGGRLLLSGPVVQERQHLGRVMVVTCNLEKIGSDHRQWQWAIQEAGGVVTAKELWGVAGRPAQFKLKSGAQFEYFYLLITADGLMDLIAEYAYG